MKYGKDLDKNAVCLVFDLLLEEINKPNNNISRQSACFVLRKLNQEYLENNLVVNYEHCKDIIEVGIRGKVHDRDFLLCLADLLERYGPTFTLGASLPQAVPYLIGSIKSNIAGRNAKDDIDKRANISASLTVLSVLAQQIIGFEYAKHVGPHYEKDVIKALELIQGETNSIMKEKEICKKAWE